MEFNFDIINILVLTVFSLNLFLGVFIFLTKKENRVNQSFFVFLISAMAWGGSMFFYRGVESLEYSIIFSRILYLSAAIIPFSFLFFIKVFPQEKYNLPEKYYKFLFIPFFVVVIISILPNVLITNVLINLGQEKIIIFNRNYHTIYALYILSYFSICYMLLFVKYFKFRNIERKQITYVIFGTLVSTLIGVVTNLLLPYFNDFKFNWLGQVGIIFMISAISYSIIKHRLFNTKVVATQLIVFILWTASFFRILISSNKADLMVNLVFLLVTVVIGILLIRSVMNEVEQREKVERLAKDLEGANRELEGANEKLKEVDKLKSEFLSLATHQIRAPLTAIKGYASLMLEGDYGKLAPDARGAVQTIFNSCQNLVVIVTEFLDISRIEQGRMKYDLAEFDVNKLLSEVVLELKPTIEKAELTIDFLSKDESNIVYADIGKIKQVIGNFIDNSIKYTPKGGVTIKTKDEGDKIKISIRDTGIGVAPDDIPKLFTKFTRAKDAFRTNVIGTGLGLYVAKQMIEAQNGKVWVESEGLGKGSTFYIELPKK